ncbi:hypothetical protein [Daejeonella sp.]|uniref:hypothetical protein n=1 Tax=Daejeonella sp. TaxID=2805397 RepID=UPI0025BF69B1|nr:hypothetical protein [Daejeonella sp.]
MDNQIFDKKVKRKELDNKIKLMFLIGIIGIIGFFAYQRFSLTENVARETANRFFHMMTNKNPDYNAIKKLYPNLNWTRVVFNKLCTIDNVSRNSDGDYEIYATYSPGKIVNYPVSLVIGRENNEIVIKSSRGISYAYYDRVLEYGKKKGCFTGEENDFQLEELINEKNIRNELEISASLRAQQLQNNLKISDNLKADWGYITGDVTITNDNNFDFGYFDINCSVEFYDSSNRITSSDKVMISRLNAYSSNTGMVSNSLNNSKKYKVLVSLNITEDLKNRVKDLIINEVRYGCD